MKPVDPGEDEGARKLVLAKDQPQYLPLPVLYYPIQGRVLSKWSFSAAERGAIADGASVYMHTWTFGQPFPPVQFMVEGVTYDEDDYLAESSNGEGR